PWPPRETGAAVVHPERGIAAAAARLLLSGEQPAAAGPPPERMRLREGTCRTIRVRLARSCAMKSASRARLLAVAALGALALSACAAPASPGASASSRACIILPDSASAPRWERDDRPALTKAIETAGFTAAVRNAEGATGSYEQFGEELLAGGCGVMILADLDRAAEKVARSARAAGVPVIAYDRPVKGADYLVAFDHQNTGRLQGEAIVDGLLAAGKDPATSTVYFVGGSPKDTSASLVRAGAVSVMSSAGIVVGAGFDGTRSEEHTSELQSRENLVCRLLLE